MIDFKASIVFHNVWAAINKKTIGITGQPEHFYNLIIEEGSSRSTKTWSNFQVLFLYLYETPLSTATVLRDTQKSCRDIVEEDWKKWIADPMCRKQQYEKGEITIQQFDALTEKENLKQYFIENKTNHKWTFKHNNNFIRFTGLDDEDDAMGMTQTLCWINEPYNFGKEVYLQLKQRSKVIVFDWNPKQRHWVEEEKKQDSTFVNHSTFRDNPFINPESKKQILSYQSVSHSKAVIEKHISYFNAVNYNCSVNALELPNNVCNELARCQYNEATGSASEYHWQVFGLGLKSEKPNRIFKGWGKITLEEWNNLPYNSYYGMDFGTTNPSSLVELKYADGCFFMRKLMYKPMSQMQQGSDSNPGGITKELELLNIKKNDIIIADSADKNNRQDIQRNGYNILPAKKGPDSVVAGINLINKFKVYYVEDEELEYEYENYEWEVVNGVNLDRPIKKDDHILDGFRYIHTWLCNYLSIK